MPHVARAATCRLLVGSLALVALLFAPARALAAPPAEERGDKLASTPAEALVHLSGERLPTGGPASPLVPEYQSLAGAFSTDTLMATVTMLAAYPTRYTSTTHYANAAARMRDRFAGLGVDQAYLHNFTCCGGTRQNVVAIKRGRVRPDEIVIVGAHLDCTSQTPQTNAPGAEDNASGSAAVYEMARLLARVDTERTIHFVLFGGEEQGLYGSAAYATMARNENWNVVGVIVLDMVGYYNPAGADLWLEGFTTGTNSMWLVDLVRQHAQTYSGLNVYVYPGNGWGSDHESFHARGFPAMLSIENEWSSYPCYHRSCDTPSYITGSFLRRIAAANATAALQLAVPAFVPASVSGRVDLVGTGDDSGATVTVAGTAYPPAVTAQNGSYTLPNLLPGTYVLRAEKQGYLPVTMTGVVLSSGEQAAIDFLLLPEASAVAEGGAPPPTAALLEVGPATPSPFRTATEIAFSLRDPGQVWLRILDAQGRAVRELLAGETKAAGRHRIRWDGRDAGGRKAASGVYWAEVQAEGALGTGGAPPLTERATARLPLVRLR